nr:hypothetical protein [Tanacetum cinerariifolium]
MKKKNRPVKRLWFGYDWISTGSRLGIPNRWSGGADIKWVRLVRGGSDYRLGQHPHIFWFNNGMWIGSGGSTCGFGSTWMVELTSTDVVPSDVVPARVGIQLLGLLIAVVPMQIGSRCTWPLIVTCNDSNLERMV